MSTEKDTKELTLLEKAEQDAAEAAAKLERMQAARARLDKAETELKQAQAEEAKAADAWGKAQEKRRKLADEVRECKTLLGIRQKASRKPKAPETAPSVPGTPVPPPPSQ